ncbi:MAG: potassium transporter TrkA [Bacteroidales bacterium]|nr:potassium transporter TrkA [Bacteroidales bacterium]
MKTSFKERISYRFDNFMTKGTGALVSGLFWVTMIIVIIVALVVTVFTITEPEGEQLSFIEAFWQSLLRTLDPGTMAEDEGWPFRINMFIVTIAGIFILSILIGVLSSGLEAKLEQLRKGRSKVIEKKHTVILGWSPKIFTILDEIIEANSNYKNGRIVVLGDRDKVEMEDEIKDNIKDFKTTKVICRSGNPIVPNDLSMVNIDTARSIIVLSPEGESPDSEVIKTVLAITNNPDRKKDKYHIVAEIHNETDANVCKMVGKDEVEVVLSTDIISKITAQTCRQSGLSMVYMEIMAYEGDEIYMQEQNELLGKTYGEALFAYEDSSLIGIKKKANSKISINPNMQTPIEQGDELICISEDDDTIILNGKDFTIDDSIFSESGLSINAPEKTLILGWNKCGYTICKEIDSYAQPGSAINIIANIPDIDKIIDSKNLNMINSDLKVLEGDTTKRSFLETLNYSEYDYIILLSYSEIMKNEEADTTSLMSLLHLRDIAERNSLKMTIVSEMKSDENRKLAEVTNANDFILSEKVISLLLAQISETKELSYVFEDIFDSGGSEIYLKPITDYIKPNTETDFYNLVESARRQGHSAIGYRLMQYERDSDRNYGITINPPKSKKLIFDKNDKLIVFADN